MSYSQDRLSLCRRMSSMQKGEEEKIKKMWKRIFNTFEVGDTVDTPIGKGEIIEIDGRVAKVYFSEVIHGGFTLTLPLKLLRFLETNEDEKTR